MATNHNRPATVFCYGNCAFRTRKDEAQKERATLPLQKRPHVSATKIRTRASGTVIEPKFNTARLRGVKLRLRKKDEICLRCCIKRQIKHSCEYSAKLLFI